jgi:hypothetical protein
MSRFGFRAPNSGIVIFRKAILGLGLSAGILDMPSILVARGCMRHWQFKVDSPSLDNKTVLQVSAHGAIRLDHMPGRVILKSSTRENEKLSDRMAILRSGQRLYLLLKGLQCTSQPGVTYHLYLDLPEGASPSPEDVHHIGIINFFAAGSSDKAVNMGAESWRSFDITELVDKLAARKLLTDTTTVTIVTFRKPEAGSNPIIDSMVLVAQ